MDLIMDQEPIIWEKQINIQEVKKKKKSTLTLFPKIYGLSRSN
jgi:hypothetical protein